MALARSMTMWGREAAKREAVCPAPFNGVGVRPDLLQVAPCHVFQVFAACGARRADADDDGAIAVGERHRDRERDRRGDVRTKLLIAVEAEEDGTHMSSEITVFEKAGGILSKNISLRADGTINADGSACVMVRGSARRAKVADVHALGALFEQLSRIRRSRSA
jgi:hypothetical protein